MRSSASGLADLIAQRAADDPGHVLYEDARSHRAVTAGDLSRLTAAWADRFMQAGLGPSASVLIDTDDVLATAVLQVAAIAAGHRAVTIDHGSGREEPSRIAGLIRGAGMTVGDRGEERSVAGAPWTAVGDDLLPAAMREGTAAPGADPAGSGAAVLFTSGSTGTPKGVELLEQQLLFVARRIAEHHGLTPADRGFNPLPLSHVNPQVVGVLATLVAGSTLVLDARFRRTGFWELLRERRITWLNAVPAILAVLARTGELDPPDGLRFIRCASAPLPDHVREAFAGIPFILSWGMTEGASQITATDPQDAATVSGVGLPQGSEVEVRGEAGELWVRGPGIVRRYLFDAAADRFDDDGWLRTGDVGSVDVDGRVALAGRSDDVINRGGEKVYPADVEEVLLGDAGVLEAVVVGRPDDILGQVPVAYVIPVPDGGLEVDALRARCEEQLPRFKRPVEILVVDDLPRAPAGKVRRSEVRRIAAEPTA
ncbi:class I adenylate-forming enzyme family protein [Pseudolysinimonas sp.]|uniref:class I adenylate-forming enzyme family protein n=1 Tax=Pseudolysinimonas sp. TaxID=2680009 RepID=UPI003F8153A6